VHRICTLSGKSLPKPWTTQERLTSFVFACSCRITPIFMMSNVTGAGLPQLKTLLNCLPTSQGGSKYLTDAPLEFSISDVFSVPFAGSVAVSVVILRGGMGVLR
jgi:GTPase